MRRTVPYVPVVVKGSSHRRQTSIVGMRDREKRIALLTTPIHEGWLNQMEIYFCVSGSVFDDSGAENRLSLTLNTAEPLSGREIVADQSSRG